MLPPNKDILLQTRTTVSFMGTKASLFLEYYRDRGLLSALTATYVYLSRSIVRGYYMVPISNLARSFGVQVLILTERSSQQPVGTPKEKLVERGCQFKNSLLCLQNDGEKDLKDNYRMCIDKIDLQI
jgi:hypothetical protein